MGRKLDLDYLRDQIIGNSYCFETPFGKRLMTYADYTASGRSLKFVENYLIKIQAYYANTHTEDDASGRSMTHLLHQAEDSIKRHLNATENCYLIPVGTGATGAIGRLQQILGVYIPPATRKRLLEIADKIKATKPEHGEISAELEAEFAQAMPVVFIGPYEHHSNDISWRESFSEVVEVDLNEAGEIDLDDLQKKLSDPRYADRLKIGSFSAASNVTGIISPVYDIAKILHQHDALACFDFAASAPYVEIDMNRDGECYFDAVFLSPHKFIGGPGSMGM
ncbi:MAG: aminotransferase class V-fold PLP-dependent enzyme, partial [Candidatus Marinimicrobia bacterium]|nr:aminotransferase class V-fold PLP-dependent enzyme [Candidatus Neomarinimicrobiota bacterium]